MRRPGVSVRWRRPSRCSSKPANVPAYIDQADNHAASSSIAANPASSLGIVGSAAGPATGVGVAGEASASTCARCGIPQFGWLFVGFVASFFGAQITVVAVAKQVYDLTGSSLAVGAVAAAELIPLMVLALIGGAIADAFDRRRVLWTCEIGILICALLLAWNASFGQPQAVGDLSCWRR